MFKHSDLMFKVAAAGLPTVIASGPGVLASTGVQAAGSGPEMGMAQDAITATRIEPASATSLIALERAAARVAAREQANKQATAGLGGFAVPNGSTGKISSLVTAIKAAAAILPTHLANEVQRAARGGLALPAGSAAKMSSVVTMLTAATETVNWHSKQQARAVQRAARSGLAVPAGSASFLTMLKAATDDPEGVAVREYKAMIKMCLPSVLAHPTWTRAPAFCKSFLEANLKGSVPATTTDANQKRGEVVGEEDEDPSEDEDVEATLPVWVWIVIAAVNVPALVVLFYLGAGCFCGSQDHGQWSSGHYQGAHAWGPPLPRHRDSHYYAAAAPVRVYTKAYKQPSPQAWGQW